MRERHDPEIDRNAERVCVSQASLYQANSYLSISFSVAIHFFSPREDLLGGTRGFRADNGVVWPVVIFRDG
jgi:hypothetical protein